MLAQWEGLDVEALARLAEAVLEAREKGRTVFIAGNGGSAATASHWATDFSKTATRPGRRRLNSLSLTDNVAFITAVANDLSFDDVFVHQLDPALKPEDLVILISGSGNSPNLLKAASFANARGAVTIGLLGFDGGRLKSLVKIPILVASDQYGVIEDLHMAVGHIVTFFLKQHR